MASGYPNRVLRHSGSEPMVEPVCESALARQADAPHFQQCPRERPAWAPAQKDADALRQPNVLAHFPLREHRGVQEVSHHGPRGRSRYGGVRLVGATKMLLKAPRCIYSRNVAEAFLKGKDK